MEEKNNLRRRILCTFLVSRWRFMYRLPLAVHALSEELIWIRRPTSCLFCLRPLLLRYQKNRLFLYLMSDL